MGPSIAERLKGYSIPGVLILGSAMCHAGSAVAHPVLLLTNFSRYRDRVFSHLWSVVGVICAADTPESLEPILADSSGIILDVGPGAGHQVFRFSNPKDIKAIYGAEPGESMHAALKDRAAQAGLGEKYTILHCGAEPESLLPALAKEGLLKMPEAGNEQTVDYSPFDEIVCVRVLCGIPQQRATIQGLYNLLKPGGRMVVCEHVVNSGDHGTGGTHLGSFLQSFYMALGWSFWLCGCDLRRDTFKVLQEVAQQDGGWEKVQIEVTDAWSTIPHIVGYLVKRR